MRNIFSLQTCLVTIFFVAGAFNLAHRLSLAWPLTSSIIKNEDYDPEIRTEYWIQSANIARTTGAWLALPDGKGGLTSLENYSSADDCGHAFFLGLWAQTRKDPVGREDLVRINFVINAAGIFALSAIFCAARTPVAGGILLFYLVNKSIPGPLPGWDVYSSYIGVACLSLVPTVWIWSRLVVQRSLKEELVWGTFSYLCLGLAYLIRAPIGHIGLVGLILGGLVGWTINRRHKVILNYALVGALFLSAPYWRSGLVFVRPWTGPVSEGQHKTGHGIWQTFFHGLGTEPNPWGIQWDDKYGYDLVKSIEPSVLYLSEPYMKIMRTLYLRCLSERPKTVFEIYWKKLLKVASLPVKFLGMSVVVASGIWFTVLSLVAVFIPHYRRHTLISGAILAFLFLFLAQGVLGIPWLKHLYPSKIILIIALLAGVESFIRRMVSGPESRS